MKPKNVSLVFLLGLLSFGSFSFLTLTGAILLDSDVSISQVTQNGSSFWITLDYDFSVAPAREETESLVVLILLTLPLGDTNQYVGSLLFFRTTTGNNLLFWMLGDPYASVGLWQSGSEDEHFQAVYNQLSLIFIECPDMDDPGLSIIALAKLLEIGTIDQITVDFHPILNEFLPDLQSIEVIPLDSTSTTTTKAKGFPGFLLPVNLGILILIGLKHRKKDS